MGIIEILTTMVLPALLPVGTNAIKEATAKWLGSPGPRTFEESLQWEQAQVSRMQALAALDTAIGQPSQWVVDLRASARYLIVFAVLLWASVAYLVHGEDALVAYSTSGDPVTTTLGMLTQSAVFFLLGDRIFVNSRGRR